MSRRPAEITIKIIDAMNKGSILMEDLYDFMRLGGFMYGFHGSKEKARIFHNRSRLRRQESNAAISRLKDMDRFHNALSRLVGDGLIVRKKVGGRSILSATAAGIAQCREWKRWLASHPSAPVPVGASTRYEKIQSPSSIIVSFDIPEREAGKRAWLRSALKNLDFKILHRSTWIGDNVLPKELLSEIHRLRMDGYVQIFSVVRHGTMRS